MADGMDLQTAIQLAKLRLSAVEEQLIFNTLLDIDRRIHEFMLTEDGKKEIREPYEFS